MAGAGGETRGRRHTARMPRSRREGAVGGLEQLVPSDPALEVEEEALALQAAAVAGEAAGRPDDPVAGHDDADRVAPVGQADSTRGTWAAEPLGELAVGDR